MRGTVTVRENLGKKRWVEGSDLFKGKKLALCSPPDLYFDA